MITKNDCLTLLVSLEDHGIDIDLPMKKLITSKDIPMDVLKFILDHRGIEVANFYELLRKKHNQKKSPLYHNIVKELDDPEELITTLACLLVQIALYSNKLKTVLVHWAANEPERIIPLPFYLGVLRNFLVEILNRNLLLVKGYSTLDTLNELDINSTVDKSLACLLLL